MNGKASTTTAPERRLRDAAPAVALAAVALAVYANAIPGGFVWDDEHIVVGNPDTRDLSALPRVLLSPDETPPYYRPLNRASYLVDYQLFGMDPHGFHAVNVALHVANVLLLYGLGRRLFRARAPAFVAAALLAVHPIHSEPVNFVTARNNLFALLFMLAAFAFFVDAEERHSRARAWLSGLAFFLGAASKEQAFAVLPVLAAWSFLARRADGATSEERARAGRGRHALDPRRAAARLAPHAIAVALYVALRTISLGAAVGSVGGGDGLLSRVAKNSFILPRYLGLVLFPRDLTIFHAVPRDLLSAGWLLLAWTAIAAAIILLLQHRTLPIVVGLLWFGCNYLPIANIVPIPSALVAERYLYVAAVGLWIVAADIVLRLYRRVPWKRTLAAAGVLVGSALAARTAARNLDWRDDLALARSAVAVDPRSVSARFNLGVVLKDGGDLEGARREWQAALDVDPDDARPLVQMGTLSAVRGDLAGAERYYRRAIRSDPATPLAHYNLARICERTGRIGEAVQHYDAFLDLPSPRENLPFVAAARERVARLRAEAAAALP